MTTIEGKPTNIERFGVFLPSFVWPGDGPDRARGIVDFAREVEEIGFDSIFITDHLLAAKQFYSVSFLEPLTALSLVAGVTEPVLLAKQLATLQYLSNNRFILGAGVGWYPPEYAATGVTKSERGGRTDEILDIIVPLLEGETVTYHGKFYSIDDVLIEPLPSRRPDVWIGGGSQLADPGSPDLPRLVEPVKRRILAAEGWVPRPTCPPEDIAGDWDELQTYLKDNGRDPADLVVAHENFYHFVATQDPVKAREEQHQAMLEVMSEARGPEYLERVYLFGTPDEVVESLQARVDAGVQSFMLHTMTPDPAQLEQWATHVIPHVRFPADR
jgi:alkanesulfonate monooxygenase SsuD/methylene tetrahydromethanopterin reductase-like flavin-dependent oxidoreductase (luciferase family)